MSEAPKLYRFFSDNLNNFTSLSTSYLWFSAVSDFNDPFEGCVTDLVSYAKPEKYDDGRFINLFKNSSAFSHISRLEKEKMLLNIRTEGKTNWSKFKSEQLGIFESAHKKTLANHLEKYRWCCFSQVSEEVQHPNLSRLMWSHYANGLRGFLVEFEKERLIDSLEGHLGEDVLISPMTYDKLAPINFYDELATLVEDGSPTMGKLISLKSNDWKYESEFRIGAKSSIVQYDANVISRVIIGAKMNSRYKELLMSVLRGHPVLREVVIEEAYVDKRDFKIKTRLPLGV
jgi:hypothetical protein